MITLALTTSTSQGGLALFKGKNPNPIFEETWTNRQGKSDLGVSILNTALKEVGEPHSNISGILLDIGPGSFTGCRVSCAVAKALAFDLDIMIHTISSLEVLHFQNCGETKGQRLSVINAHRGLYYVWDSEAKATALLTKAALEMKIEALLKDGGSQNFIAGDFDFSEFPLLRGKKEEISSKNFPLPRAMGEIYFQMAGVYKQTAWTEVEPNYIRAPDAVINR